MPNWDKLADAIHIAENGHSLDKGEQYGIHSVHYESEKEARQICLRTCKRAWTRYIVGNRAKNTANQGFGGYFAYLGKRYCPVNAVNWTRMVSCLYEQG